MSPTSYRAGPTRSVGRRVPKAWGPVNPRGSDAGGLQGAGEDGQRLHQVVRAPDQLVLGGETDPPVVAAVGEDAARVQVSIDQGAHRGLARPAVGLALGTRQQRAQLEQ